MQQTRARACCTHAAGCATSHLVQPGAGTWKGAVGTLPPSSPSTSALRPAASNAPASRAARAFLGLSTSSVGAASAPRPNAARKLGCGHAIQMRHVTLDLRTLTCTSSHFFMPQRQQHRRSFWAQAEGRQEAQLHTGNACILINKYPSTHYATLHAHHSIAS